MREHALPQDITSYRFHIIGSMTLKQFAEVAGGVSLGFFIYITNLPVVLKWPFIVLSAGIGALAAFVPFEERPLDQWLVAFVRALYRPTQFFWKRTSKIPEPFLFQPKSEVHSLIKDVDLTPVRRQRVKEYLRSIDVTEDQDSLDQYNTQRASEILQVFENPNSATSLGDVRAVMANPKTSDQSLPPAARSNTTVPETAPTSLTTTAETAPTTPAAPQFSPITGNTGVEVNLPNLMQTQNPAAAEAVAATLPQENLPSIQVAPQQPAASASIPTYFSVDSVKSAGTTFAPSTAYAPTAVASVTATATPQGASVSVPTMNTVSVEKTMQPTQPPEVIQAANIAGSGHVYVDQASLGQTATVTATQAVVQNKQLPFPERPTDPNKVVGMVLDTQGNPLSNAIVEIITQDGLPARAVKTNLLGQFFITTPLNDGTYTLTAEKEGFQFAPQQLILAGTVIDPIEVKSN